MTQRHQRLLGWASTLAACFWAWWGILETFHEGYGFTLWQYLAALPHYLLMTTVFVAAALIGIRWPALGGGLHVAAALALIWFFRAAAAIMLYPFIVGPLVLMAASYWLGRPHPRRRAAAVVSGLPLLIVIIFAAEPAYRVSQRFDDGDRSARRVTGNGVDLIWAPEGPGWPRDGVTWEQARRICRHLSANGMSLSETPQEIWQLPTVEEAVRSMTSMARIAPGGGTRSDAPLLTSGGRTRSRHYGTSLPGNLLVDGHRGGRSHGSHYRVRRQGLAAAEVLPHEFASVPGRAAWRQAEVVRRGRARWAEPNVGPESR